ncbi:hypothetical protein [Nostoc sp. FACHB-133]|uniref:hypothetical protein n=1 Tax=Nostoc sp. FACHB-133 TaxID=2692835 RepID=UPI0016834098|nr:hypothetical protein [Nostoc sp. FACHB-133]MBD2527124.1 hypothetical protein [Nostoc sp. FACHB-133]
MLSPSATWVAIHSSVSAMDGWLVLWKIEIALMVAPAMPAAVNYAVKIMAVFHDGFILLALLLQYKKP